jgi:hypothetical protein
MRRPPNPRVHKHTVMNKPRGGGVRAPVLLISGNWIAAAGFKIGAKYTAVSDEEGRLILTVYKPAPDAPKRR